MFSALRSWCLTEALKDHGGGRFSLLYSGEPAFEPEDIFTCLLCVGCIQVYGCVSVYIMKRERNSPTVITFK